MENIVECQNKHKEKKAVIMCMQMEAIEVSPARYQLIKEMREMGIEIYLFLCGKLRKSAKNIRQDIKHFQNAKGMKNKEIQKKIIDYNPNIVVAFTYEDTDVLYQLPQKLKKTKFYYYNLEINTKSYYIQGYKKYTWNYFIKLMRYPISVFKENFYTKKCELLVIQDKERKKLAKKYYVSHKNTLLIPNSYIYGNEIEFGSYRSGIVYSGGARKKYLIDYLEEFKNIKTVPIMFAGSFDNWSREHLIKLHKTNPNIMMEDQILDSIEYTKYLQKYAVGLICYSKSDDNNINHIGLSSGKFFKHLSLGQPVIVLGAKMIGYEVEKYRLGIVADDASQIEEAYKEIMQNYEGYQSNVIQTYCKKYDFRKVIKPFLETM